MFKAQRQIHEKKGKIYMLHVRSLWHYYTTEMIRLAIPIPDIADLKWKGAAVGASKQYAKNIKEAVKHR